MNSLIAFVSTSFAAESGVVLQTPLPLNATPSPFQVTAFDLPPQSPDYGPASERLACPVVVSLAPDGTARFEAPDCPAGMQAAALAALAAWRFQPEGEAEPSTATITFVQRTSETLGSVSLWAEIDPGPEHADDEGQAGLKLASPARPSKPIPLLLPKSARKKGLLPGPCSIRVRVSNGGAVLESEPVACEEGLLDHTRQLLARTLFEPARVDGRRSEDVIELTLDYTDKKR